MMLFSVQGVKFNGSGSNCSIDGNIGEIIIKNQFTFRVRFKIISDNYPYDILKKDGEYKLSINENGNILFSVWNGSDWEISVVGSTVQVGNWYDVICLVGIGATMINEVMYINSVLDKYEKIAQAGNISQTINLLVIGNCEVIIDNFMCWNKMLMDDEIDVIFKGGIVFDRLGFWLAFEDVNNDNFETTDVVYKRYKGILNNFEVVDGKEFEEIKTSQNKVIVVKKY